MMTIPEKVNKAVLAYKHALLYTPRLEGQAERALVAAIAEAIEEGMRNAAHAAVYAAFDALNPDAAAETK